MARRLWRPMLPILVLGGIAAVVVAIRQVRPEPTFEPGLEFNPDFDLTLDEILADIRGEAPHG